MAWLTTIGPSAEQVEYRLADGAGCGQARVGKDLAVDYRTEHEHDLTWIGKGLAAVGIEAGTALDEDGKDAARALMSGVDPSTGDVLVEPKMARDPRGKLAAAPVVDAVREAAEAAEQTVDEHLAQVSPKTQERFARLVRGVDRDADAHRAGVDELRRVATAAGVDITELYDGQALAEADKYADFRVRIGNRGYDLTLDIPKSLSVLYGLADAETADGLRETYMDAVRDTAAAMESWTAYGMRGHHGDGQTAGRADGEGFLGWVTLHDTARPVDGAVPDPHLHAHLNFANLVQSREDGTWSTLANGGRDLHRHTPAAGQYLRARLRHLTSERYGMTWGRSDATGAWEVDGVGEELRDHFSKRGQQIKQRLAEQGIDVDDATVAQGQAAAAETREAKRDVTAPRPGDLRGEWQDQARTEGVDPARLVAEAMPGPRDPAVEADRIDAEAVADYVLDPEDGLTAHTKFVEHPAVLAAVADAVDGGIADIAELERLAADVAADARVAALPAPAGGVVTHPQRYTTTNIVDAETMILTAARDRLAGDYARVDADVTAGAIDTFEQGAGFTLSPEQRAVVTRLAVAGNGVDAVVGVAGSGKTTVMSALRGAHEAAGHTILGTSTAAVAAHHLQAETGIHSMSVAKLLTRRDGLAGVDVLVVDEAAMVDDRDLAQLLDEAGQSGTQVIGVGDPQQLKSPGVGSAFRDVHTLVGGLALLENRRQRDAAHRAALSTWRTGQRRAALDGLAEAGAIRAGDTLDDVRAGMLDHWADKRTQWSDPHDQIHGHLMLAGTNRDVDELNALAQDHRITEGELDPARSYTYVQAGGGRLTLHPGDHVMLRTNEYAQAGGDGGVDLLNGRRGVVTGLDARTGDAVVTWREQGPDGPELVDADASADYIRAGGLSLAYALTVHKAQGQTAESVTASLTGLDPNAAYPALTRHRGELQAWLTRDVVEDEATRLRLGDPATPEEALRRALDAYTTFLERPEREEMALAELGDPDELLPHHRPTTDAAAEVVAEADTEPPRPPDADRHQDQARPVLDETAHDDDAVVAPADDEAVVEPVGTADWWTRPHGALTSAELDRAVAAADATSAHLHAQADAAAANNRALAEHRGVMAEARDNEIARREAAIAMARAGHGEAVAAVHAQRDHLAAAAVAHRQAVAEAAAAEQMLPALDTARTTLAETQARAQRPRLVLAAQGTNRAEQEALAAEQAAVLRGLHEQQQAHTETAAGYRARARDEVAAAGIPHTDRTGRSAEELLTAHDARRDELLAAARTADIDAAAQPSAQWLAIQQRPLRLPHRDVRDAPTPEQVSAVDAHTEALHAEKDQRAGQRPIEQLRDDADRKTARKQARRDRDAVDNDPRLAAAARAEHEAEQRRQAEHDAAEQARRDEADRAADEAYRRRALDEASRDSGPDLSR